MTTSVLGCCVFSNLRTAMKLFTAVLQIKKAKISVVEDSGHINVLVIILLVTAKALRTYAVKATF